MTITCVEAERFLSRYLDGELPAERRGEVEEHLGSCEACRMMLADWSRIGITSIDLLRQAIPSAPLEAVPAQPAGRTSLRLARRRPVAQRPSSWIPLAAAAGVLLALGLFLAVSSRPSPRAGSPDVARRNEPMVAPPDAPQTVDAGEAAGPSGVRVDPAAPVPSPAPEAVAPVVAAAKNSSVEEQPAVGPSDVQADAAPAAAPAAAPPVAVPTPAPAPPPATAIVVARVDRAQGEVYVVSDGVWTRARGGEKLLAGQGLQTVGPASLAVVRYPDPTRLELRGDTIVAGLAERQAASAAGAAQGRRVEVRQGVLLADISRQPAGQPMLFVSPHAESTVLGTRLTLSVGPDGTRLDVKEGRVRFTRASDTASVDVARGQYAVAAEGVELAAKSPDAAADPVVIEVEHLDSSRGIRPGDGPPVRRLFLEPNPDASGGWCVAVPGKGMEVAGEVALPKGSWFVWVRHRDDLEGTLAFDMLAGGRLLGRVTSPGEDKEWSWRRFPVRSDGTLRLTLRSATEGIEAGALATRSNPYAFLNRWDQIVLTRDPTFNPEHRK